MGDIFEVSKIKKGNNEEKRATIKPAATKEYHRRKINERREKQKKSK